jgi:hypothetical protein
MDEDNSHDLDAGNSINVTPDRGGDQIFRRRAARFSGWIKNRTAGGLDASTLARPVVAQVPFPHRNCSAVTVFPPVTRFWSRSFDADAADDEARFVEKAQEDAGVCFRSWQAATQQVENRWARLPGDFMAQAMQGA